MHRNVKFQNAWDVHRTIDRRLRESCDPIIRSVPKARLLRRVGDDCLKRLDQRQSAISQLRGPDDWQTIGSVIAVSFKDALSSGTFDGAPYGTPVRDHDTLLRNLKSGYLPVMCQEASYTHRRVDALRRLAKLGVVVSASETERDLSAKASAFAVAYQMVKSRLATTVLYITSQFVVQNPFTTESNPYLVEQLWVVRDSGDGQLVRLIALEIDSEEHLTHKSQVQDEDRDGILAALGYEVFRAAGWWTRVDPTRVIHSFLEAAEIPYVKRMELAIPGPRIKDYRCASCREPMIRAEDGYGIVEHKGLCVHEECYERVIDGGEFDWIE